MKKKLFAIAIALMMCVCLLPSLSVAFAESEARSLLLEQSSARDWVYSDADDKLTMNEESWDQYELETQMKGMYAYYDSDDVRHSLNELDLTIGMKVHVVGTNAHCVPTVYVTEGASSKTCVQQRANGALYVIEYLNAGGENASGPYTGAKLSSGDVYTLRIDYKHGSLDVYVNGDKVVEDLAVNGAPSVKLSTNSGKGAFSDFVVETTSDVKTFVKEYPDVADGNENLLDLPGFTNRLSSTEVTNSGDTFEITKNNLNKNIIVTNDYLSSFRFYRPDVDEYSDGTDMDWLFETTLVFGEYGESEAWRGMGVVIGETEKGYIRIRAMRAGYLILGDVDKSSGNDLNNVAESFGNVDAAPGKEVALKVYYIDNKITVFVNGTKALTYSLDMTLKLGVHAICNKGTLKNTSFRFIQSVAPAKIEAQSSETAKFEFSRGKLKSDKADTAVSGNLDSFRVSLEDKENYFVMKSVGSDKSELYRMTGLESYEVVKQNSLATLTSMTLKAVEIAEDGNIVIAFRHNDKGIERTILRIAKNGVATIETGSNSLKTLASADVTLASETEIVAVIANGKASIKINGEYVFKNVDIPELGNALAFGGKNAEYTVDGLSYRYIEDIRFEEPQKELFRPVEWEGEANTEYIAPPLPEKTPSGGKQGCGGAIGGTSFAFAGVVAAAVLALKKRK